MIYIIDIFIVYPIILSYSTSCSFSSLFLTFIQIKFLMLLGFLFFLHPLRYSLFFKFILYLVLLFPFVITVCYLQVFLVRSIFRNFILPNSYDDVFFSHSWQAMSDHESCGAGSKYLESGLDLSLSLNVEGLGCLFEVHYWFLFEESTSDASPFLFSIFKLQYSFTN